MLAPDEVLVALAPSLAAPASHGRVLVASLGRRAEPGRRRRSGCSPALAIGSTIEAVDVIVAAGPERQGLGAAVWDRLRRAAEGRVIAV